MFRNRQPAWPYRCTGKDARTGVFFFALRAGAARAFPAAGHAHGREAAASPAANTAARRRPARGADRVRQTRASAPWDGAGGDIAGSEHGGMTKAGARRRSCAPNPRASHMAARAAASPAGNTAARPKSCARRRSCAPNPRVYPTWRHGQRHRRQRTRRRGESRRAAQIVCAQPARASHRAARAAAPPAANTAARRKPARGANRVRKLFRTAQNDRALQLLPF